MKLVSKKMAAGVVAAAAVLVCAAGVWAVGFDNWRVVSRDLTRRPVDVPGVQP